MNQVVPIKQGTPALAFSGPQLELIKKTVAADCNNDEFNYFMEVAKFRGLNPLLKQIYAFVYNKDNEEKRRLSIVTSIDGYRLIASRCRDYRPDSNPPEHTYDPALKSDSNPAGLVKSVVRCHKLGPDNAWYEVAGEAFWGEFVPLKDTGEDADYEWVETGETWPDSGKPKKRKQLKAGAQVKRVPDGKWASMPHVMLAKCAEAQALRRGWPEDFSGVYVSEEMDRARTLDLTASDALEEHARDRRLQLTRANDSVCIVWDPGKPMEAVPIDHFAEEVERRLSQFTSVGDLKGWQETNRVGLQHFWAKQKADALELKKLIERREAELRAGGGA